MTWFKKGYADKQKKQILNKGLFITMIFLQSVMFFFAKLDEILRSNFFIFPPDLSVTSLPPYDGKGQMLHFTFIPILSPLRLQSITKSKPYQKASPGAGKLRRRRITTKKYSCITQLYFFIYLLPCAFSPLHVPQETPKEQKHQRDLHRKYVMLARYSWA